MYKITLKALAGEHDENHLQAYNGVECQENFADYFDEVHSLLKPIESGYMRFSVIDNKLWVITEYISSQRLSTIALNLLKDYTQGQWSDGIGEGFEQEPVRYVEDTELYVSPWFSGQVIFVEQTQI